MLAVLLVIFTLILLWMLRQNGPTLPGPSGSLPLAGHLVQFRNLVLRVKYVHLAWAELWRKYGPLTSIKLGKDRIVVLNGFEAIKSALTMDQCVLVTDGADWKQQRSFIVQHFRSAGVKGDEMEGLVSVESEELVKLLQQKFSGSEGMELELRNLCDISVLNVLWTIVAGKRFELSDPRLHKLMSMLHEYFMQPLIAILIDLFMAGSDTTSNSLAFCLLRLMLSPDVQRKAQQEIDQVVGRSRHPSLADRTQLPYTEAVVMEVLRISTVAATTPAHRTLRSCEILGHHIPQDTVLVPNISGVLLDPDYWKDPEIFRPERFLDADGKILKEERYIPFGLGKRRCLGDALAKSTIFLFISALLQNFQFELVPGQEKPSLLPIDGLTLAPKPFSGIVKQREH
ncbi:hypothetical protein B566_EDAN004823 [Ephemera danica]|nr:hypothetical protein B566_EDAN004823 [Ephemera danica]